ncbi:nitrilase-related carbon-nitrogen hydrolase [Cryobacterium sp. Y11]|jgi:N-carbamoylputrescine amidase|uniref:nitrilase-related carbon-nitrogen hydrolase n=1 Tax=Cryobacterium sp. Y11 TaxID=2045016 RepID=UPI000CE355F1|nr:nitrilase-related carbon-nitrogen hydrolase [Cryobacterium sp. Y11]
MSNGTTSDTRNIVRTAITQATWTGDEESMIAKHEGFVRTAAAQGVQVICFQELFHGPYFGIVQDAKYYDYAQSVPGPIVERFQKLAAEYNMVIVVPVYEEEQPGVLYNTAAVIDADGSYLGKYRKHHIPHLPQFWEKFYFRPGNTDYPVFETKYGKIGVYICYDRHFPEGWRALGLNGAEIVFNPSATKPGLSNRLWELEQPAAAVANQYYVGANNRIGNEQDEFGDEAVTFYGSSYFVDPTGNYVGAIASTDTEEIVVRDLDLGVIREVRRDWQFYRDRRPDSYEPLVAP